ncbi:MAG: hypothetical protein OXU63_16445 [Acidobacteriota bacterium]|nr:hypothetical protein [Acidobacteriota bacterium]
MNPQTLKPFASGPGRVFTSPLARMFVLLLGCLLHRRRLQRGRQSDTPHGAQVRCGESA